MTTDAIQKRERLMVDLSNAKRLYLAEYRNVDNAIYMIGYQGMSVDGFFRLLFSHGIMRIIDIRKNPLSRVYGFHKSALACVSEYIGLDYVHVPDLGVPADWRKNLHSLSDYEALFAKYKNEILPNNESMVYKVLDMINEEPSVIMCWEENPSFCHRSCVADKLYTLSKMKVCDLRVDYDVRKDAN